MNKVTEFFAEVRKEAAKVTWPTRQETVVTALMVVVLTVLAGIFFLVVDWGLAQASRALINIRF